MPDSRFPILGTTAAPMLGRESILQKMTGALTKAVPDHLQVVGPRFAGKTVILHELANRLRQPDSPYTAVALWDLRHHTPATDAIFMQRLAQELSTALHARHADYAEHLKGSQDNPYQDIAEVLSALKDEGAQVLVIMDGFDRPLSNGKLTRNLWDQLRELALNPSLRLVTASRRTLRDLIRHPDAQTSDFWNIFDPAPVRVGCFDEHDLTAVLAKMPEYQLAVGAQTELWCASNGFPVLMLSVLNAICKKGATGVVSHEAMNQACESAFPALRDTLDTLWNDCSPSCQDLMRRVLDEESVQRAGISVSDADMLIERGFVNTAANKLQRPNRFLRKYLDEQPHEGSALIRMFGAADAYEKNLKSVLERRIAQINGIDSTMKRHLERGIEDLPSHPDMFLTNVRGIVNHAFELIFRKELPDNRIPPEWISIWKRNGERKIDDWETKFPKGGARVHLLSLMTGSGNSDPCAQYITRGTYLLMNAAYAYGDFGQHIEGYAVSVGTGYTALHICIELAAAITTEINNQ